MTEDFPASSGLPANADQPVKDSSENESPPKRDDGVPWIMGSALGLFIGWVFALGAMANSSLGVSDDRLSNEEVLAWFTAATVLALGPPAIGCVVLSRRRRRSGGVTWTGFVACAILFSFGSVTLLWPTIDQARSAITTAVKRAQPPTALERSRTLAEAKAEVAETATEAFASIDRTILEDSRTLRSDDCTLSNLGPGERAVFQAESAPRSDELRDSSEERGQLLMKNAIAFWEQHGLVVESSFGHDGVYMSDGPGAISTVIIGREGAVVTIQSACFAK
ncbi:hypothetical protein ABC270_08210 [Curtobacterium sp. 1P10AnD]|uniref:hypothetical protein n=1 Tax=Curtobacterium sp. 1P10AnD TaxID=3132283 RepID=UPI0039A00651